VIENVDFGWHVGEALSALSEAAYERVKFVFALAFTQPERVDSYEYVNEEWGTLHIILIENVLFVLAETLRRFHLMSVTVLTDDPWDPSFEPTAYPN